MIFHHLLILFHSCFLLPQPSTTSRQTLLFRTMKRKKCWLQWQIQYCYSRFHAKALGKVAKTQRKAKGEKDTRVKCLLKECLYLKDVVFSLEIISAQQQFLGLSSAYRRDKAGVGGVVRVQRLVCWERTPVCPPPELWVQHPGERREIPPTAPRGTLPRARARHLTWGGAPGPRPQPFSEIGSEICRSGWLGNRATVLWPPAASGEVQPGY